MHTVYLLHFAQFIPGGKNRHYIGVSADLDQRIERHRAGQSGPMFAIARDWNIRFEVARTWEFTDVQEAYDMERWLKEMRTSPRYCPTCSSKPWKTGNAHIGACERYADRLKREMFQRQYYMDLRRRGLEHRQALQVSRGKEMV